MELNQLINLEIFKNISKENLEKFYDGKNYFIRRIKKDTLYKRKGDDIEYVFILLKGEMVGEMIGLDGKVLRVETLTKGQMLAPILVFGKIKTYPVNVIVTKDTELLCISRKYFIKYFLKDENFIQNMFDEISEKFSYLSDKIFFLSFHTIEKKFAHYLLENQNNDFIVESSMNITELAKYFCVQRPSLSAVISKFKRNKVISYINNKKFKIINYGKLIDIARGAE